MLNETASNKIVARQGSFRSKRFISVRLQKSRAVSSRELCWFAERLSKSVRIYCLRKFSERLSSVASGLGRWACPRFLSQVFARFRIKSGGEPTFPTLSLFNVSDRSSLAWFSGLDY